MRFRVVPLLLLVVLLGCDNRKRWTNPILDVNCGKLKLHFEERVEHIGFPAGVTSFTPALLMDDGSGWRAVNARGEHSSPSGYTSLLAATARFHRFPSRPDEDAYHHSTWVLYVDPAVISEAEYDAVCACVDANISAIDAAWDKPRNPTENFGLSTERRFRMHAALRIKYDPRFSYADRTTLGVLWDCPSHAAIKTGVPDELVFFSTKDTFVGVIGRISRDEKHAELYSFRQLIPAVQRIVGQNYKEFYGQCRNARGKTLYETLAPVDWKP
ncbi:MAG TPA: hypothetical protein VLV78_07710 [Thermoanaerobaculia bacterium]|nr:hypothetical protein [Thermoanaerobaculia bacterium]